MTTFSNIACSCTQITGLHLSTGTKTTLWLLRSTKGQKPSQTAQRVQSSRLFLCVNANGLTNRNPVNFTLRKLSVSLSGA